MVQVTPESPPRSASDPIPVTREKKEAFVVVGHNVTLDKLIKKNT